MIGARVRLAELEAEVETTKDLIRLLSHATTPVKAKRKRRSHSDAFKSKVVLEARKTSVTTVAKKYDISRSLVDKWIRGSQ